MSRIDIVYETNKTARIFQNYDLLRKNIGDEKMKVVKKHLDRLRAAPNFLSFLTLGLGKPHSLSGDLIGYYAVSVTGNTRLIIQPACREKTPEDLRKCTEVIVKGVADYHGEKNNWIIP